MNPSPRNPHNPQEIVIIACCERCGRFINYASSRANHYHRNKVRWVHHSWCKRCQ